MVWNKAFYISSAALLTFALGCAQAAGGPRGCLGGTQGCLASELQESETGSLNSGTQTFSCTATPYPSQVAVGEDVRLQVDTFAGIGTKSIPGYIANFGTSTSIYGHYNADKAGTIVRKTVEVRDSKNNKAYCEFAVEVLDATSYDGFTCRIDIAQITESQKSLPAGSLADFKFTAINAPGDVTFKLFQPNSNWSVSDQQLVKTSAIEATTQVQYDFNGTKIAKVEAVSNGRTVLCRKTFNVGNTGSTSGGTLLGCNVETAPLGYGSDGSLASLTGSVTRVRAIPQGGTAPFTLTYKGSDTTGFMAPKILGATSVGPSALPQLNMRVQKAGAPLVKVELKDSTGKAVNCQTYHISTPADLVAIAADQEVASGITGPAIKVYRGWDAALTEQFPAFEGSFQNGVRVATADFDGDGVQDIAAAAGPTGGSRIRVYKGSRTAWTNTKPSPNLLLEAVSGLSDTDDFTIAAGDVNRDGKADIIVGSGCPSVAPRIRILSGADPSIVLANFELPSVNGVRAGVAGLAAADFDNDGYTDIAVSPCSQGILRAFSGKAVADNFAALPTNNTIPTMIANFTAHSGYLGPIGVAAADVNGDGSMDLIAGSGDYADTRYWDHAPPVKIFSCTGALIRSIAPLENHRGLFQVGAADLNGDGYAEVIVAGGTLDLKPEVEFHGGFKQPFDLKFPTKKFEPFSDFYGTLFLGAGGS